MILACTSFGGKNHIAPPPEILLAFTSTQGLNSPERIRKFMIPAFTTEFAETHGNEIEKICALRGQNFVSESVYQQQLISATSFNAESRVSNIKAKTLILSGDSDGVAPLQNSILEGK
ncbi:MAG: hypothetical protein LC768_03035 [Acidobacteria bacterium]|nr:hypothetical protein [Acidobacteriota bacterium]MCA1637307.1 hypothetical protein [Acidobacteriota bacterium]